MTDKLPDVPDEPTPADQTEEAKVARDIADDVEAEVEKRTGPEG
jgi:hypothetical protein